ncbi:hypothetical protein [Azotobacter salinestris]|uniref:hypothetical protein n=1 Tax=Azotobacter salinestris TaxID=69964 RepID=UPI0032DEAD66
MPTRTKAGENERRFEDLFRKSAPTTPLLGKKRYTRGEVEISVDQSFIHEGVEYLVEVDSANMAKLLTGQYVLLNQLYTGDKGKAFFLLVHTYRAYNPKRSTNNLALINHELYDGDGIKFGAIHIDDLMQGWVNGVEGFLGILKRA